MRASSLKDGKFYVGMTSNVERRLNEHNSGKSISTRYRRPFVLIYREQFATRRDARKREKYLKSGPGHEYLRAISDAVVERPDVVPKNGTQSG
jgi:putative endonuclease